MLYAIVKALEEEKGFAKQGKVKENFKKHFVQGRNMSTEEFEKKWHKSEKFVSELIDCGVPQFTTMIKASTTWGNPDYHVCEFNIAEKKHNREFVKTLLSIGAVWGDDFGLTVRRMEVSNSVNENGDEPFTAAFKKLKENNPQYEKLLEIYEKADKTDKYLYITDFCWKERPPMYDCGSSNMATTVEAFKAIIY